MKIKVPDQVPKPKATLCYVPKPNHMVRCDRKQGHTGPHSWEYKETT